MAERKSRKSEKNKKYDVADFGATPVVTEQPITATLETNYMPYAMSVIVSRAIPEIDGFKPSHRKILYTMQRIGLLGNHRLKSNTVVGEVMKLNPHGDASIYEAMVRLTRGNEALLHPFIDSKGSFGKQYSTISYAASRYTEVKLDSFCEEIFRGIDKDAVDMVDNYDSTLKEPVLLPTSFPNILVSPNVGIAVGMASNICSFNLAEVCDATIALMSDPDTDLLEIMKAPDFSTGGMLIYNREKMAEIYKTGRGSFKVRARWNYDKKANRIEITQIPYTTKAEVIIDKIAELVKGGKLRDISDVRDETGLDGLRVAIDLKRGADHEKLMEKLYRLTTLEDTFSCNFNVLIGGTPMTLGVADILTEWTAWRCECVKRELYFNLCKMKDKLHLLMGLKELLLDIDKAIKIIRETKHEKDVIPNLMKGFNIDEVQAEYIAEIKLRNLNEEYILNRIAETEKLEKDIAETEATLASEKKVKKLIAKQLTAVKEKYAKPRKTQLIFEEDAPVYEEPEEEAYPIIVVMTRDGYFKKLNPPKTAAAAAKGEEHNLKDNDVIIARYETMSDNDLLFFTDKCQVYKSKASDFDFVKASALGDYIPAKLSFDDGERVMMMCPTKDYKGSAAIFFENGKAISIPLESYVTKTNRKKLTNAYSDDVPAVAIIHVPEKQGREPSCEFMIKASSGKVMIVNSDQLPVKATRTASGVTIFTIKKAQKIESAVKFVDDGSEDMKKFSKYRKSKLPSTGTLLENIDPEFLQVKMF